MLVKSYKGVMHIARLLVRLETVQFYLYQRVDFGPVVTVCRYLILCTPFDC